MDEPIRLTAHYTPELLVRANRAYLLRSFGVKPALAFAIVIACWLTLIALGERGWAVGAVGALIVFVAMLVTAIYRVTIRRALTRLASMRTKSVEIVLSGEAFAARSDLGAAELPWSRITKLWRYPDFWLVFYEGNNYFVLPLAGVDESARDLIEDKISQAATRH